MNMRRVYLLSYILLIIFSVFNLLDTTGSTQSPEVTEDYDGDGISDAYEIFFGLDPVNSSDAMFDYDHDSLSNIAESIKLSDPFEKDTDRDGFIDSIDSNAVSRAYIRWGDPHFTQAEQYEYAHPDWLLGAYKVGGEWFYQEGESNTFISGWYTTRDSLQVSEYGSSSAGSLCVDLARNILTNNLRYAVHFGGRDGQPCPSDYPFISLNLLSTNGQMIAENLYGNLFSITNDYSGETRFIVSANCTNDLVIILNVPLMRFPDAAVIQLRHGAGEIIIYEGLLYIDEDGDGLDADSERQLGTSDYNADTDGDGVSDYAEWRNGRDPTRPDNGDDDDDDVHDKKGIIYVDQAIGSDSYTGYSAEVATLKGGKKKGPKKTVRGGLSIAGERDTIVIRSGNYGENLDISGKNLKVVIEGKVKL
jgi:hypothetical protein